MAQDVSAASEPAAPGRAVLPCCFLAVAGLDRPQPDQQSEGTTRVMHYSRPARALVRGVAAVSSSNVYAVGSSVQGTDRFPLVLHWDGQAWTQQTISGPVPDGELSGVKVVSATDIWAVGDADVPGTNRRQPLVLHFNGSSWTSTRVPQVAGMSR